MGFILSSGSSESLFVLLFYILFTTCNGELPTELNPFMDKLFEHDECEDFVGSDFTSIATTACEPYTCDFPRQICQRPAAQYREKSANTCRDVPTKCLTAANGGVPVPAALFRPTAPPRVQPPLGPRPLIGGGHRHGHGHSSVTMRPFNPLEVCQLDAPTGRFCGFKLMYVYNKETLQCDEFWFPGCPTAETNSNLFRELQDCQKIADLCKPTPPPFRPLIPMTPPTVSPPPPPTLPPPPPPPPPPSPVAGLTGFLGPGTGTGTPLGGTGGATAGGDGDGDMGLIGFIQKGFSTAQAIKQGGPQGKEAAAAAAGQILQQFTGFDVNNIAGNFGNFFGG